MAGAPEPRRDETFALGDGRTLAFTEWGDTAGRAVLLFHGMPGSRLFCPDLEVTVSAGVRLITYDRPGYGASEARDPVVRLGDYVPDVVALLDHVGAQRASVIGWSGGGCIAAAVAALAPERVSSLVLISSPGPLDEVPGAWDALDDLRRPTAEAAQSDPQRAHRAIVANMDNFMEDPSSLLGSGTGPDGVVLADPTHGPMLRRQIVEALRTGPRGLADDLVASWLDWGFRLDEISVPTTVFHGERDRYNSEDVRTYARCVRGARLVVWPDVGHLGVVRHWGEVLGATRW